MVYEERSTGCEELALRIARGFDPFHLGAGVMLTTDTVWFVAERGIDRWVIVGALKWEPFSVIELQTELEAHEPFFLRLAGAFGQPWDQIADDFAPEIRTQMAEISLVTNVAHGDLEGYLAERSTSYWRKARRLADELSELGTVDAFRRLPDVVEELGRDLEDDDE